MLWEKRFGTPKTPLQNALKINAKTPATPNFLHEHINCVNVGFTNNFCPKHFRMPKDFASSQNSYNSMVNVIS